jgi:hypothetical protein
MPEGAPELTMATMAIAGEFGDFPPAGLRQTLELTEISATLPETRVNAVDALK